MVNQDRSLLVKQVNMINLSNFVIYFWSFTICPYSRVKVMSENYKIAKDLEGQVLTLIEAIVPEETRAVAAKSIFRRLFHEWVQKLDVGTCKSFANGILNIQTTEGVLSNGEIYSHKEYPPINQSSINIKSN